MQDKKISDDTVKHISSLANLKLTDEEGKILQQQMARIIDYVEKLNELDTEDVKPTYHTIDLKNVMRDDEQTGQGLATDDALKNAPGKADGFFKVPKIITGQE